MRNTDAIISKGEKGKSIIGICRTLYLTSIITVRFSESENGLEESFTKRQFKKFSTKKIFSPYLAMKIAVIDTIIDGEADGFLTKLLTGLIAKGNEVHLVTKGAPHEKIRQEIEGSETILHTNLWQADGFVEETAPVLAKWLNEFAPDIYLISNSADIGWVVLPLLDPRIATLAIGHHDSEYFYLPARHYRLFLTRVIGVSPEVCVGYVLSSVIEKEKVEWISDDEESNDDETLDGEARFWKMIDHYENCFEKAIEDAEIALRKTYHDYPLMETCRSRLPMWLRRLKAKALK